MKDAFLKGNNSKYGDLSDPGNWRPTTPTSVFAKLFHSQLSEYFLENDIISDYQFGFLSGRSRQLSDLFCT